jgi:hypothetical protein
MARRRPPLQDRLDNDKHEQFARCIGSGNEPLVCYFGVGYPMDEEAAKSLARTKAIRLRAEEWFRQTKPRGYQLNGYKHPV